MPIPHIFTSGDIAASSEVNQNFSYLEDIVGSASTPVSLRPPGDILLGPRRSVQISAAGDSGKNATSGYLYLGWNAEFYQAPGGIFRLRRFNANEGAAAVQIGNRGVAIAATHDEQGELNSAMQNAIAVRPHAITPYIYINPKWAMTDRDEPPNDQPGRQRLTYVPVEPFSYTGTLIAAGTRRIRMSSLQGSPVPPEARGVHVHVRIGMPASGRQKKKPLREKAPTQIHYRMTQARVGATSMAHGIEVIGTSHADIRTYHHGNGPVMFGLTGSDKGYVIEWNNATINEFVGVVVGYYI